MELNRTAEQWQKCDPKAMAKMSEPAIMYALADARSDVLRMHAEIERLKQVRCEGCGYLVSEREHLGCKSEKTLKDLERLTTERDNAEKREYEVLGRANALEAELKATQARLVAALATLRDIGDFAHDRSTGPAVEDALWEVRRMAYELLAPNA